MLSIWGVVQVYEGRLVVQAHFKLLLTLQARISLWTKQVIWASLKPGGGKVPLPFRRLWRAEAKD